jgi:hypothetical protein
MKHHLLISLAASLFVANCHAQGAIYRCGNEYTNTISEAQKSKCKLLETGNVSVMPVPRPGTAGAAPPNRVASSVAAGTRVDAVDQRARDTDARLILEAELKKAEARREELVREYNNGEPEKLGPETRNHQKYLDRVAGLKSSIERIDSDIGGIRREIGRAAVSR